VEVEVNHLHVHVPTLPLNTVETVAPVQLQNHKNVEPTHAQSMVNLPNGQNIANVPHHVVTVELNTNHDRVQTPPLLMVVTNVTA